MGPFQGVDQYQEGDTSEEDLAAGVLTTMRRPLAEVKIMDSGVQNFVSLQAMEQEEAPWAKGQWEMDQIDQGQWEMDRKDQGQWEAAQWEIPQWIKDQRGMNQWDKDQMDNHHPIKDKVKEKDHYKRCFNPFWGCYKVEEEVKWEFQIQLQRMS